MKNYFNGFIKLSMKKSLISFALFGVIALQAQVVNPKNIIVSRVGDGTTAFITNAPTSSVSLLEFNHKVGNQAAPIKKVDLSDISLSPTVPHVGQGKAYYPNGGASELIATMNAAGFPVIYSLSSVNVKGDTKLVATTDKGGRTNAIKPESTVLAKAGDNYVLRGLAFAPSLTTGE